MSEEDTFNLKAKFETKKNMYNKACRQRIERGYCDEDVWETQSYLNNIITGMLKSLATDGVGHPTQYTDRHGITHEYKNAAEYQAKLLSIVDKFEDIQYHLDNDVECTCKNDGTDFQKKVYEAFDELASVYLGLWD